MSRRRLFILVAVLFITSFTVGALIRISLATPPPPQPHPTVTKTATPDPLAWYRSLPTPSCPKDPELLRDFYRQGQCPQGARK